MQQNKSAYFIVTLILATITWGSNSSIARQAFAAPTEGITAKPKHMIAEVTGTVELKRQGSSRFVPVSRNTSLRPGDLLRPASGAKVRVLCDDGNTRPVPTGVITGLNAICPPPQTSHSNSRIVKPRVGDLNIPYIISPRATLLLTDKPLLRWNGATGANSFTVTVRGQGLNWTKQVSRAEVCQGNTCDLVYSGSPLQPEVSYRLVIQTDTNRSSTEDTTGGLGFKLLEAGEANEVQAIAQRLREQDLPDEVKALALADLYARYNLIAEAIATLEELAKNQKLAAVYRRLGDLYLQIGLAREAEVQYLEAVNVAKQSGELEEQATAQAGLSEVSIALGRREEAVRLLQEALAGYEQLGDTQRVNELQERLARLNR